MEGLHFIYFADPMCSWCWGFAPVIERLHAAYGEALPIRLVLGGLRPGTDQSMTEQAKASTRTHWEHVREASGQPFDFAFFDRQGFVYDTDPAARATVLARRRRPELTLAYLHRAQRAFYAENRDITKFQVLADLAAEFGLDRDDFLASLDAEDLKHETWRDYGTSQRAGVKGFPTLIAGPNTDGTFGLITSGFQPAEQILPVIETWVAGLRAA
ncbi:MAG TPA: DsbA family protein [Caulobacteraceae bacterium]|jgi:putative protein-disulfide isomerase|nr:DsbA family protein [Caulobacteraceae bacterium]